jgi:hypothetical protein
MQSLVWDGKKGTDQATRTCRREQSNFQATWNLLTAWGTT